MPFSSNVTIVEVGSRDGFQMEQKQEEEKLVTNRVTINPDSVSEITVKYVYDD